VNPDSYRPVVETDKNEGKKSVSGNQNVFLLNNQNQSIKPKKKLNPNAANFFNPNSLNFNSNQQQ